MLSTDQQKNRLEDLLERIRKNKDRTGRAPAAAAPVQAAAPAAPAAKPPVVAAATPTAPVTPPAAAVSAAPAPEAAKPKPKQPVAPLIELPTPPEPMAAETEEDDIDFGFAASFQSNLPGAAAPVGTPPSPAVSPLAAEPAPAPLSPAAAPVVAAPQTQAFESAPEASGPVAEVIGDRTEDWTIAAVLQRAWQFGVK